MPYKRRELLPLPYPYRNGQNRVAGLLGGSKQARRVPVLPAFEPMPTRPRLPDERWPDTRSDRRASR